MCTAHRRHKIIHEKLAVPAIPVNLSTVLDCSFLGRKEQVDENTNYVSHREISFTF